MKKILGIITLFFVLLTTSVYANSCDSKTLSSLKSAAARVKMTYDISDENGTYVLKYKIYNITDDIYVILSKKNDSTNLTSIHKQNTVDGTYSFDEYNISEVDEYTLEIKSENPECSNLRKITVAKPKRNSLYDNPECQYAETADLKYCQEWITKEFTYSEEKVLSILKEKRKQNTTTTTKKIDAKQEEEKSGFSYFLSLFKNKKFIAIILLVIGIITDLIFMVTYYRRIKKESEML